MGTIPATGAELSMGRMGAAYYNGAPTTQVSYGTSAPTRRLYTQIAGRTATQTTALSAVYGGRTTPFTY
jgi:hypothetical protein